MVRKSCQNVATTDRWERAATKPRGLCKVRVSARRQAAVLADCPPRRTRRTRHGAGERHPPSRKSPRADRLQRLLLRALWHALGTYPPRAPTDTYTPTRNLLFMTPAIVQNSFWRRFIYSVLDKLRESKMSVALRSILRRTWCPRSRSEALASTAGHQWGIRIKVMEGIKNINKFIIRVLVEAGSHGRDLSDGCDLQKYPRIYRPPGATYKGRATPARAAQQPCGHHRHRSCLLTPSAPQPPQPPRHSLHSSPQGIGTQLIITCYSNRWHFRIYTKLHK